MTRYIIFNDPPSLQQCLESIKNNNDHTGWEWVESSFEFGSISSTRNDESTTTSKPLQEPEKSATAIWDTSSSQFKDAVERKRKGRARGISSSSDLEEEEEPQSLQKNKKKKKPRVSHHHHYYYEGDESICQSFFMFPPPSQPRQTSFPVTADRYDPSSSRTRQEVSSPQQKRRVNEGDNEDGDDDETTFSRHYNLTSILENSEISSSSPPPSPSSSSSSPLRETSSLELSIGPPPHLPWFLHDLTKLDQLKKRFSDHHHQTSLNNDPLSSGAGPVVSVLTIISNLILKRVGDQNTSLCEISLRDETGGGGEIKLIAWGQQGEELSNVLKIGDVVYFGKVRLLKSKWINPTHSSSTIQLELRLIESVSKVGISFRTNTEDGDGHEEDEMYRFDLESWSRELEQARAVKAIVDWWRNK